MVKRYSALNNLMTCLPFWDQALALSTWYSYTS